MSREIKFRAVYQQEIYEVTEIMWSDETAYLYAPSVEEYDSGLLVPLNEIELLQFTGLKDKNGKEIYEGDIIQFSHMDIEKPQPVLPVVWDEIACGFVCRNSETSRGVDMASHYDTISGEIIGDIYQNPELLK